MRENDDFDLRDFLPYLLNQAAEASSLAFAKKYKDRYGMLRTEWRVLFHLGRYGEMTAKEIGLRASVHKTKISRAVKALEDKRFLKRSVMAEDRRNERLSLTRQGQAAFRDLFAEARAHDADMAARFTPEENRVFRACLARIAWGDA